MKRMGGWAAALAVAAMAALAMGGGEQQTYKESPVGGANSPKPSPPQKLVLETAELKAKTFSVKVPTGSYTAPAGGAANYSVAGPIVAFKGVDGVWRGHGYMETYPRLEKFTGKVEEGGATLAYAFEGGKTYDVTLKVEGDAIVLTETSTLGPRNVWVFDCYYGGDDGASNAWMPGAGLALDATGKKHMSLVLPCFYDKPEVTINPAAKEEGAEKAAYGVAVVSAEAEKKDMAAFWVVDVGAWKNADAMGIQLWQHRQLPGDPSSRHFLGPETKSDSTPNPRTAALLGQSLYEPHVTVELQLGVGTRKIAFSAPGKGDTKETLAEKVKQAMQASAVE